MVESSFFPFLPGIEVVSEAPESNILYCQTISLIGERQCQIEAWSASPGTLLKVKGGSDFYIHPDGIAIVNPEKVILKKINNRNKLHSNLSELEKDIFLGPALVLALAMRNSWSLHASAAMFQKQTTVFLGESGQGKSTLAAYLDESNWKRVADDILPATLEDTGAQIWPRFPQLKLPPDKQPGMNFPEQLPLDRICVLASVDENANPEIELLRPGQAIQVLLSHTAGTRLFEPKLLKKHLDFCAGVAEQVPVYRLANPHRKDALPMVKELLENSC